MAVHLGSVPSWNVRPSRSNSSENISWKSRPSLWYRDFVDMAVGRVSGSTHVASTKKATDDDDLEEGGWGGVNGPVPLSKLVQVRDDVKDDMKTKRPLW